MVRLLALMANNGDERLVRSKQRVADHGEVFTPEWIVDAMLNLVRAETERIDSRFLEPACGSGNFLVQVLIHKLAAVEDRYGKNEFEKRHFALLGLMCIYGIELLRDNVVECRSNMLDVLADHFDVKEADAFYRASRFVLSQNIVHGDAQTMQSNDGEPISFAEWGYLGKGKFQRRDFRFDALTQTAAFSQEGNLFAELGMHEIFVPVKSYPVVNMDELSNFSIGEEIESTSKEVT